MFGIDWNRNGVIDGFDHMMDFMIIQEMEEDEQDESEDDEEDDAY